MKALAYNISEDQYVGSRYELMDINRKERRKKTQFKRTITKIMFYPLLYMLFINYFDGSIGTNTAVFFMMIIPIRLGIFFMNRKDKKKILTTLKAEYMNNKIIQEKHNLEIGEDNLELRTDTSYISFKWDDVKAVGKTENYIYLILHNKQEILIPMSELGTHYEELKALVKSLKKKDECVGM